MKTNLRNLLWIIPLALVILTPLWKPPLAVFLKPPGGYDKAAAVRAAEQSRHFVLDSIIIMLSTLGKTTWVINADKAFTGKNDRDINMENIDAVYTNKKRERTLITSNKGNYQIDERHMILTDDVIIRKPEKAQEMYTELLHYYDDKKIIVSPVDVMIKGTNFTIFGGRLDYDLTTDAYELGEHVICKF